MAKIEIEPIRILMVEDDPEDVMLAQRAFTKARIQNQPDVVNSGQEALDYLQNRGAYADAERYAKPDLILLDLNMPGMDGREFLRRIKNISVLARIPIAIVSTSDFEKDIEYGREFGVKNFIIKPLQVDNILQLCTMLESLRIVLVRPTA